MTDKVNKWIKFYPSLELPKERVSIAYDTHDERGVRYAYGYFQFYNGTCGCFWKDGNEQPKVVKTKDIKYWMPVPSFDVQEEPVSNDFEMALAEMIDKAQASVVEPLVIAAQWKDELIKLAKGEEPVSEDFKAALEKKVREAQNWTYIEEEGGECPLNEEFGADELEEFAKWGADWQKNLNKKDFELLKEWFEDISEKCEHLTSGNVSHNGKMIRGFARNCAEYIKTDLL